MTEEINNSGRLGLSLLRRKKRAPYSVAVPEDRNTSHSSSSSTCSDHSTQNDDKLTTVDSFGDGSHSTTKTAGSSSVVVDLDFFTVDNGGAMLVSLPAPASTSTSTSRRLGWPSRKGPPMPPSTRLQRQWCMNNQLNLHQGSCRQLDCPMAE